jgi:hypothetical protein
MQSDSTKTQTTTIVPIDPNSNALVKTENTDQRDEVMHETQALVQALQHRIQAEFEAAGNMTREAYLNALRQARQAIEREPFISPDRFSFEQMEQSMHSMQKQAEHNFLVVSGELESISVRLADAARTIWKEISNSNSNSTKS